MKCNQCGYENLDNAIYCKKCDTRLNVDFKYLRKFDIGYVIFGIVSVILFVIGLSGDLQTAASIIVLCLGYQGIGFMLSLLLIHDVFKHKNSANLVMYVVFSVIYIYLGLWFCVILDISSQYDAIVAASIVSQIFAHVLILVISRLKKLTVKRLTIFTVISACMPILFLIAYAMIYLFIILIVVALFLGGGKGHSHAVAPSTTGYLNYDVNKLTNDKKVGKVNIDFITYDLYEIETAQGKQQVYKKGNKVILYKKK